MKSLFQVEWSLPTTLAIVVKTLRAARQKQVKKFRVANERNRERERERKGKGKKRRVKNEE